MSHSLRPVDPPLESAAPSASDRFDASHDVRVVGSRTFAAVHWALWRGERQRLSPTDSRNGSLRWLERDAEILLADVLRANGLQGQGWNIVPSWDVSASGERLLCIAGSSSLGAGKTSGVLYEVRLADRRVDVVHEPDAKSDERLMACAYLNDDELLLLAKRSLRWMRRRDGQLEEVARARLSKAERLAAGRAQDRTVAVASCGGPKALFFVLEKDRLTKVAEELKPIHEVRVERGTPLVRMADEWFAVELPAGSTSSRKRADSAAARHPLEAAPIEVRACGWDEAAPRVVEPIAAALSTGAPAPGKPRMAGPSVAAGLDRDALLVWKNGEVIRLPIPNVIRFDVAADGGHAWAIAQSQSILGAKSVLEARLDAPDWREVTARGVSSWGPDEVAHFDADHLVVKSHDAIHLLQRRGDAFEPLHRVKCPIDSSLLSYTAKSCVVLTSHRSVTLYGMSGGKLKKLTEASLTGQSRGGLVPRAYATAEGALWVHGSRYFELRLAP